MTGMSNELPTSIVIFGASGDLTQRKLIPSLFNLCRKDRLPGKWQIVGHSKTPYTDEAFRQHLADGAKQFASFQYDQKDWDEFAANVHYQQGGYNEQPDFKQLANYLGQWDQGTGNRLYYMATPPGLFTDIIEQLGATGQLDETNGWRRVVIEKPFGTDLASAQALNAQIHKTLNERQIYRIDHYLGKETVQNILVARFANTIFEPLWNRNYIDHIQITVAETVGVGHRAGYYDSVGVLRDMFQNHLLQLTSLVAMEPPTSFEAEALRNEKVKVLKSIRPLDDEQAVLQETVRGQYKGYRQEEGVKPDSTTATFGAVRFEIDNWRWQGVPFYARSGKCLKDKISQITIQFKEPPHLMFPRTTSKITPNELVLYLQPDEGLHWCFEAKVPDTAADMRSVDMEFHYAEAFGETSIPEAYERLLLDAMSGDASLFTRADEVETAWSLIDPIAKAWEVDQTPHLRFYNQGSWGPAESDELMSRSGRAWMDGVHVHNAAHQAA
jgi:glucose-6-phosphate 1-dehydrogenase